MKTLACSVSTSLVTVFYYTQPSPVVKYGGRYRRRMDINSLHIVLCIFKQRMNYLSPPLFLCPGLVSTYPEFRLLCVRRNIQYFLYMLLIFTLYDIKVLRYSYFGQTLHAR